MNAIVGQRSSARRGVGDAAYPDAGDRADPLDEASHEAELVGPRGPERRAKPVRTAAVGVAGLARPTALGHAEPFEVPQRACEAREQLVRERAGLEPARDRVSGWSHVIRRQCLEQLATSPEDAQVGTVDLVGRADEEVGAERGDVDRKVRRPVDRVDPEVRPGRVDAVGISRTGLIVPTAFDARPTATSRVRGPRASSRSSSRSVQSSGSTPTQRTTRSRSRAIASHGATFASWSMRVRMISSPGARLAPIARLSANVIVVMFGPKAISSGSVAPTRSATADRVPAMSASVSALAANAPWVFELLRVR